MTWHSPGKTDAGFCRNTIETRINSLLHELAALKRRVQKRSIHDTRVQSRRMRAALEIFEDLFPSRPWKTLYAQVRRITKTLGKARETEVVLALSQKLASGDDRTDKFCREYLEERIRKELQNLILQLQKRLRTIDVAPLRKQTELLLVGLSPEGIEANARSGTAVERARIRSGTPGSGKRSHSELQPPLFRLQENPLARGRRVLKDLSRPILAFRANYDFPRATDEHLHDLRMAAKKLRYAMEIFDSVWPQGLKKEITLARALQDAGGDYHDWCVLHQRVQEEIRGLTIRETDHMAFQMSRLLALIEDRRGELRRKMLPALTRLQSARQSLLVGTKSRSRVKRAAGVAN